MISWAYSFTRNQTNMNTNNITIALVVLAIAVGSVYLLTANTRQDRMGGEEHHEDEMVEGHEIYPGLVVDKIKNNEDIILLDVRTLEEYEETHLENALLLPVQELSFQSLANIGLGENAKNKEIIIYCRSGARSKTAYDIMESLGYTNIKSVAGGMIHWQEDMHPFTESGAYMGSHMMGGVGESNIKTSDTNPRIVLDRTLHDFGEIPQYGGVVETTFTIKNNGKETLIIGELSTSCACTKAEISKTEISTGESAALVVYFDPDLHAEPKDVFKRTVFIPTNDPTMEEAEVVIKVDIIENK